MAGRNPIRAIAGALLRAGFLLLFALPLAALLLAALTPPGEVPGPEQLLRWPPSMAAFAAVLDTIPLLRGLLNGLAITIPGVALSLTSASLAALGIRLAPARIRGLVIAAFVGATAIPYTALWLPRFVIYDALELTGHWGALWAPALFGATPLCALIFIVAIARVPMASIEAARVEGLNWLAIWWRVVLPQIRPATAVAAVLTAASFWGNHIDGLLYLHSESLQTPAQMLRGLHALGPTNWPLLMAGSMLLTLPVLIALSLALPMLDRRHGS